MDDELAAPLGAPWPFCALTPWVAISATTRVMKPIAVLAARGAGRNIRTLLEKERAGFSSGGTHRESLQENPRSGPWMSMRRAPPAGPVGHALAYVANFGGRVAGSSFAGRAPWRMA